MNKITKLIVPSLVVVLLSQSQAQAGFYDWLVSKEANGGPLVSSSIAENSFSFDKLFRPTPKQTEDILFEKIIVDKVEMEPELKVIGTYTVRATGYSSTPDQTDSTPCITATGYNVCTGTKDIIAANFYINGKKVPFGTKIRIPEIYGEKIFIVEDRMNSRYTNNIDVWFPERSLALQFGSKKVMIEIVEES